METNIYILIDPRNGEIRYVGKSNNTLERFKNHKNKCRDLNTYKRNWINELRRNNLNPEIEIIDKVTIGSWRYWETFWIQYFTFLGCRLTNYSVNGVSGGEGCSFGNQTSFKKGLVPWNKDKGHKSLCTECGIEFKSNPSNNRKLCSLECTRLYLTKNPTSGSIKKGSVPWNKGKTGYSTSRKGVKITDDAELKRLREFAVGNTYRRKKIHQYDLKMNLITTFESVTQAIKTTGIKSIGNCVTGRSKTAGGFIWQY